jgi:GNAT superfamily N-acetyltransferase
VTVRRLGPGDEAIADAACRLFGADGAIDAAGFLRREDAHLFVDDDDVGVAGWVYGHELIHPDGERTMLLYALDVAERARRTGRGRALVVAFVEHARSQGCTEVWVLTDDGNLGGRATYEAAGGLRDAVAPVMYTWRLASGRHS